MKTNLPSLHMLLLSVSLATFAVADLPKEFATPPDPARPGVYWYFMDGNQDRQEMISDLHAMKEAGIGSVVFLEVAIGVPPGPIPFMSEAWQDNVAHAFVEAGKLGMEVILGTGPGWAGSGGSWVDVSDSMQHLVSSSVKVKGPVAFHEELPVPAPHDPNAFAGMSNEHAEMRDKWFQDVAVLAYPAPAGDLAIIQDSVIKTLRDVRPYSIRHTRQRFIAPSESYPETDPATVFDPSQVIDLTSRLQPDGRLEWEIPEGEWVIMRFAIRSTGQTTRPAPRTGHGFECDKFSADSYSRHWNNFQQKILDRVIEKGGPLQPGRGLTTIHLDSWEMSSQNWSAGFREQFQKRRGYDPQPFFPTWMGYVVGDIERTERFLFDMRLTAQELVLEEYAGTIRKIAHQHGLLYSNEPYDMNPAGNIDLGSVADIPMCEFWNRAVDTEYSCIEAVSIANIMGRNIVKAEGFTNAGEGFERTPANMKNQTDWALAMGINGIVFHTYQHQPLGTEDKPGMSMGPYGIQWHRNQTFWDYLKPYHEYITRSSHLLRQGQAVADILYLTPEGAPYIFEPPADAITASARLRDKKGYAFDAVTPRILAMRAEVEGDRIAFPGGTAYRVMVLPNVPTMTPEGLEIIDRLVKAGATVIGNPPVKSPSLVNFPEADQKVQALAADMWGGTEIPAEITRVPRGRGAIYWGGDLVGGSDFPTYAAVTRLLGDIGLPEDFSSPSDKIRFKHRRTESHHLYFVSNRTEQRVVTEGIFRVEDLRPELWDPATGEMRPLPDFSHANGAMTVPLTFEPLQSYFIVFPRNSGDPKRPTTAENFPFAANVLALDGPWEVAFDPAWGGPEKATFDTLIDWTSHPEEGIRYYSGTATYRKSFDAPELPAKEDARAYLDLGTVHSISRVRLNGKDLGVAWTAPWRVDITEAVRPAGNELEIEVANTWVNRLIGDQQPQNANIRSRTWPSGLLAGREFKTGRYTFCTVNYHGADAPLTPSGLLGPVTLQVVGPDIYPPNKTGALPEHGTTLEGIVPSSLTLKFDEPVVPGTGNLILSNLTEKTQDTIDITDGSQVAFADNVLTINPTNAFLAGKSYAVRIAPGAIKDPAGNAFPGISDDQTWTFSIAANAANPIILDTFSGKPNPGNGAMIGTTPDTLNLPGHAYTEQQNANTHALMELDASVGHPGNSLKTGFNNSAHIQIGDAPPTKPVTLSLDVQLHTLQGDDSPRGIGLGFWDPLPAFFPGNQARSTAHFTGILVNPSGTLEFVRDGESQGVFTTAPEGFSKDRFLTLTYTVDPATRTITRLVFAGQDYTANFTKRFKEAFTPAMHAGFLGSTGINPNLFGRVDNFIVATP